MAKKDISDVEETQPLTQTDHNARISLESARDSVTTASTTSLVLEHLNGNAMNGKYEPYSDSNGVPAAKDPESFDMEDGKYVGVRGVDKKYRRILIGMIVVALVGWGFALFGFVSSGTYKHSSSKPHDPAATGSRGSGKKITLESVLTGQWGARKHDISWIAGKNGEDGMMLEQGEAGKDYLVVEDVKHRGSKTSSEKAITLMKNAAFDVGSKRVFPSRVWPSPDMRFVLVMSDEEKHWRHSYFGLYWIFDVEHQKGQPLDPSVPDGKIQLASWAPDSSHVVFTRDNNMFVRKIGESKRAVTQITKDGGPELFYGIPDWVYEEEVFAGNSATWWSQDSKYIAFLRTNETLVPNYLLQYFASRPSGKKPKPGLENYPELERIKYPKAGAPNPTVNIQFYDMAKDETFDVKIKDDFVDGDRLITEVVWAGSTQKVLVRETNRESDLLKVVLMDVNQRTGKTIRTKDVNALDGGWFEVSEDTTFLPADPENGRPQDGYIDTVIHEGYDHLAYFTPLDNPDPVMLTSGKWEVVRAPSAVDLKSNMVYFVATKESSTQRHIYRVNLDGTDMVPLTDINSEGYYDVSFSTGAGYALLTYNGPNIPWQKVISTISADERYEESIEKNDGLRRMAAEHEMPILKFETINVDGFDLNVLERRPPHFDEKRKYPVLFYMYQGPGSQLVDKKFTVDFQAYVASMLGYIVVTVDGRGTGFLGRKTRVVVRGNFGHWESHDQIQAAKMWAAKEYVDENRMAIWGWSYGGFMALKTLEQDGGETFKYGMAVAPVTNWRFYDSIYTERYMRTPQNNPSGYDNATISDVGRLARNVRFLFMHGVADDNVHYQSTLSLMDKLDLAGIENYDMQVFPDSDHSIYFHNANRIVYDKLSNWLVNAFNGEWLKTADPTPIININKEREKKH
ncbi:putative dipeptidyl-aminopeptidase B [Rhizodiscina lignyota]|uniref:dipeptidyl-peptidase IV n=1 Tax=Rhizodiscina lignyota TaxID=1504668 RepID=A0A9P4M6G0_9PEZI|nr:putative dipeptidyl-aminopeptidase B [Rhizodiscina lignyota]